MYCFRGCTASTAWSGSIAWSSFTTLFCHRHRFLAGASQQRQGRVSRSRVGQKNLGALWHVRPFFFQVAKHIRIFKPALTRGSEIRHPGTAKGECNAKVFRSSGSYP